MQAELAIGEAHARKDSRSFRRIACLIRWKEVDEGRKAACYYYVLHVLQSIPVLKIVKRPEGERVELGANGCTIRFVFAVKSGWEALWSLNVQTREGN